MSVDEFLLNEEDIEKFLGLLDAKIEYMDGELEKIETARKQFQGNIEDLKQKRQILTRYSQFLKQKGFGFAKQEADDFFKNIKYTEEERIPEPDYCGLDFHFIGKVMSCMKPKGHDGNCGV